jgi:HSP20 family protein
MTLVKNNYKSFNNIVDELLNNVPATWERGFNLNVPPVNIHETNDAYHLELAAPGLSKEDFKINLDKGFLTISYEKKVEEENKNYKTHRREFTAANFKRTFTVEDKIDAENIKAKYENGVLQLLLPKKEEVKIAPKEIAIQ